MTISEPKTIMSILPDLFPPELRVENAALGLERAGFRVTVMAKPSHQAAPRWHGTVIPVDPNNSLKKVLRILRRRTLSTINPAFSDSALSKTWILEQARRHKANLIIWNDLFAAHIGLTVARELEIPFVLDLHESFPYNMWSTARDKNTTSRRYSLSAWLNYEAAMCEQADLILTPGFEMNERLNGMHFIPHKKMLEFLNAEAPEDWDAMPHHATELDQHSKRDVILFVGSSSIHRGLDLIVSAMERVRAIWPEALFVVVGSGRAISLLRTQTRDLDLDEHVLLLGQKPFAEVASYIRHSHVCVVPHYRYPQTDNGIPHKLFQFMSLGKAVLVSDCSPLQRIVGEYESGLVFRSGDVDHAAEQLLRLRNKKLAKQLGSNGRRATEGPLHLRHQQMKLVEKVTELIGQP